MITIQDIVEKEFRQTTESLDDLVDSATYAMITTVESRHDKRAIVEMYISVNVAYRAAKELGKEHKLERMLSGARSILKDSDMTEEDVVKAYFSLEENK